MERGREGERERDASSAVPRAGGALSPRKCQPWVSGEAARSPTCASDEQYLRYTCARHRRHCTQTTPSLCAGGTRPLAEERRWRPGGRVREDEDPPARCRELAGRRRALAGRARTLLASASGERAGSDESSPVAVRVGAVGGDMRPGDSAQRAAHVAASQHQPPPSRKTSQVDSPSPRPPCAPRATRERAPRRAGRTHVAGSSGPGNSRLRPGRRCRPRAGACQATRSPAS
mgnify:CR=1 FL=1|jgi:hypothetical protein